MQRIDRPRRPSRRRLLKLFGGAGLASFAGAALVLTPSRSNAYYQGPRSDHFDGLRFFNPAGPGPKSIRQLVRMGLATTSARWPESVPSPFAGTPPSELVEGQARVTLIGHASYLIQTHGLAILIDPVYSERAGPFGFVGPKRINSPGIAFDDLPRIDHVLITHNHYDHLDLATVGRLWSRDRPPVTTPLGNDTILRSAMPELTATALDWGGSHAIAPGVTVHAVPTQHWSARGTRDRMHALWASFVLTTPDLTLYCVGDTGFGDGSTFRHVRETFPGVDLALLPIGAYEPRWFMRDQHMNPEEAVEALRLCGARRAVGHHWGTFRLTAEPHDEPPLLLAAALAANDLAPDRFQALRPGQAVDVERAG